MQKKKSLANFFLIISEIGSEKPVIFVLTLVYNLIPKLSALYMFCALATAAYTFDTMKVIYAEPRPYWINDNILSK